MPEIAVPHRSPVPSDLSSEPWLRAIILVDMNAFFCFGGTVRQTRMAGSAGGDYQWAARHLYYHLLV